MELSSKHLRLFVFACLLLVGFIGLHFAFNYLSRDSSASAYRDIGTPKPHSRVSISDATPAEMDNPDVARTGLPVVFSPPNDLPTGSSQISGFLSPCDDSGGLNVEGMYVAAWPEDFSPSRADFDSLEGARPSLYAAIVQENGFFRLQNLPVGVTLQLIAIGNGLVVPEQKQMTGIDSLQLTAWPVHGLIVSLVGEDQRQLNTSDRLRHTFQWPSARVDSQEYVTLPPDTAYLSLLGLDLNLSKLNDNRHTFLVLLQGSSCSERAGPVSYTASIPGYEATRAESIWAGRVQEPIARYEIHLRPLVSHWGSLTVRFHGVSRHLDFGRGRTRPLGKVRMKRTTGEIFEFFVPDLAPNEATITMDGVPAGDYWMHFEADKRLFRFPSRSEDFERVTIGATPAELNVDVSKMTGMELGFVFEGKTYTGEIGIELAVADGDREHLGMYRFNQDPFRIEGLPAGSVTILTAETPGGGPYLPTALKLELPENEIRRAQIELKARPKEPKQ